MPRLFRAHHHGPLPWRGVSTWPSANFRGVAVAKMKRTRTHRGSAFLIVFADSSLPSDCNVKKTSLKILLVRLQVRPRALPAVSGPYEACGGSVRGPAASRTDGHGVGEAKSGARPRRGARGRGARPTRRACQDHVPAAWPSAGGATRRGAGVSRTGRVGLMATHARPRAYQCEEAQKSGNCKSKKCT